MSSLPKSYTKQLNFKPIDHERLAWLATRRSSCTLAVSALWHQGLPLVIQVAGKLRRKDQVSSADFEDLVQVGNLELYNAVQTWDPEKGAFSTWVTICVRGRMLRYAATQGRSGGMTGKVDGDAATVISEADMGKVHEEASEEPEDLTDNERFARELVAGLPFREANYVQMHYFRDMSIADIAKAEGVSRQAVSKVVQRALGRLREAHDEAV